MDMNDFLATYAAPITQSMFMFALGACVGSLTNVLVYRLPRGLDVVAPPSACPACNTRLTWRENIPVLGWLALGGRCRFCKSRISPEYPLVEAFVGLLYVLIYLLWYVIRPHTLWLGVDWSTIRPEWAADGFAQTWPAFTTLLVLASSLVAMTLVDAKTFTIPLILTIVPTVFGIIVHPAHALWIQLRRPGQLLHHADHEVWTIATFGPDGWRALGAGLGAMIGLVIAALLVRFKIITRSFADYDQWEKAELASRTSTPPTAEATPEATPEAGAEAGAALAAVTTAAPDSSHTPAPDPTAPVGPQHEPTRQRREQFLVYLAAILALAFAGAILAPAFHAPALLGVAIGALVGPLLAGVIVAGRQRRAGTPPLATPASASTTTPDGDEGVVGDPAMWLAYPHARREMVRELIYVGPAIALALVGAAIAGWIGGPWTPDPVTGDVHPATPLPLWAVALGGTLMGYLIGGAVVWGVRIFGSLAFGKEAMGMGDVHLMAAVGACMGWIDATLAFFLAAFVGLYWVIASAARSGGRVERAMPYGPYLAAATMVVMLAKPVVELLLGMVLRSEGPIDLP